MLTFRGRGWPTFGKHNFAGRLRQPLTDRVRDVMSRGDLIRGVGLWEAASVLPNFTAKKIQSLVVVMMTLQLVKRKLKTTSWLGG